MAFSPRRAAAVAALAALLTGCGKAPPTTEQRAPSGRVYRLAGVGTVSYGKGERALGVEYLPDSLDDPERLALDAEELLALLSDKAERGGFGAVVVTAFKPGVLAWPRRGRTVSTVFTRGDDSVWRSRKAATPEEASTRAADLRAIDDVYARVERAVSAKDAAELEGLQTLGFWHRLADGTIRPRADENAALEQSLGAVSDISARMSVSTVTLSGSRAVVVAAMTSTGALKGSGRRFKSTTISRDLWVRTPGGWRLALSSDLSDRFEPASKR